MSSSNHGAGHCALEECVICGEMAGSLSSQVQEFAYRDGRREVVLTANIPLIACGACGETYTAEGAEEAQHEAVCKHLGRLAPAAIRELRARLGISQARLAELTRIGIASIKRWEGGTHIQNASLDAKLRALEVPQPAELPTRAGFRFQFAPSGAAREASRRWQLRPDHGGRHRSLEREVA